MVGHASGHRGFLLACTNVLPAPGDKGLDGMGKD